MIIFMDCALSNRKCLHFACIQCFLPMSCHASTFSPLFATANEHYIWVFLVSVLEKNALIAAMCEVLAELLKCAQATEMKNFNSLEHLKTNII